MIYDAIVLKLQIVFIIGIICARFFPMNPYLILAISFASILSFSAININNNQLGEKEALFEAWKNKFNKQYDDDTQIYRFQIFKANHQIILNHNIKADQKQESYYMALNQFSDLTDTQWIYAYFQSSQTRVPSNNVNALYSCNGPQPIEKDLPDQLDWSAKCNYQYNSAAITAIRNSGQCMQASHAITAAQAVQSGNYLSHGKLTQLSSQQIIDCSGQEGNHGCISGNVTYSFGYIHKHGITTQKKYPFKGFSYNCNYSINDKQTQILGCVRVTPKKQVSLKAAVRRQPVVVSINAQMLKNYSSGVFDNAKCKTKHNHWMLMVGYGRDDSINKNYWKLKNSWGSSWGQQGYLFIARKGDGEGECGVQSEVYYPIT